MPVSAVLFDLDETLFDRSGSLRAFVEDQLVRWNLASPRVLPQMVDRFLELDRRGRAPKRDVYGALAAEAGWAATLCVDLFDDYEANTWRFAEANAGAVELMTWLRLEDIPTAIVSNGETHIQLRSLLALNLDRLVDAYLISEQEGCRKPEREIFRRAADRLNVPTEHCVFVGDSPEADMAGARSLGMKTIWYPNGVSWPDDYGWRPDARIDGLSEVRPLIEAWRKTDPRGGG